MKGRGPPKLIFIFLIIARRHSLFLHCMRRFIAILRCGEGGTETAMAACGDRLFVLCFCSLAYSPLYRASNPQASGILHPPRHPLSVQLRVWRHGQRHLERERQLAALSAWMSSGGVAFRA